MLRRLVIEQWNRLSGWQRSGSAAEDTCGEAMGRFCGKWFCFAEKERCVRTADDRKRSVYGTGFNDRDGLNWPHRGKVTGMAVPEALR